MGCVSYSNRDAPFGLFGSGDPSVDALLGPLEPSGLGVDFVADKAIRRWAVDPQAQYLGPIGGLPGFTFSRASAATRINAAGDMESVGANVLRYDHDPVTLAPRGVRVERSKSIFPINSVMAGVSAGAASTAIVPGAPTGWSVSIYGGCAAQIVGEGTVKGVRYFDLKISGTNGGSYAACQIRPPNLSTGAAVDRIMSLHLSRIGGTTAGLGPSGCVAMLDAYVGSSFSGTRGKSAAGIPSGDFATSQIVTSVLTTPAGTGYITPLYQFLIEPNATVDITVRVGRWQVEDGRTATSFVPTTTSGAVTRAADVLTIPTSALPNSASEGTFFVECWRDAGPSTESATPVSLYGPGRIEINQNSAQNVYGYSGGWSLAGPTLARGTIIRAAQAWSAAAGAAMSVNGAAPSTGAVSSIPSVSQLRVGSSGAGFSWEGHIRRIAYLPRRLSNLELQAITA